jgi:hypothetical protein
MLFLLLTAFYIRQCSYNVPVSKRQLTKGYTTFSSTHETHKVQSDPGIAPLFLQRSFWRCIGGGGKSIFFTIGIAVRSVFGR